MRRKQCLELDIDHTNFMPLRDRSIGYVMLTVVTAGRSKRKLVELRYATLSIMVTQSGPVPCTSFPRDQRVMLCNAVRLRPSGKASFLGGATRQLILVRGANDCVTSILLQQLEQI